jgi:hypothetical protein
MRCKQHLLQRLQLVHLVGHASCNQGVVIDSSPLFMEHAPPLCETERIRWEDEVLLWEDRALHSRVQSTNERAGAYDSRLASSDDSAIYHHQAVQYGHSTAGLS